MPRSFDSVFYGAAGGGEDLPSDDEFNRVSFLSHFDGANNGVNNAFDDSSASNHTITRSGDAQQGSFGPFARPEGYWGVDFGAGGFGANIASNSEFAIGSSSNFTFEYFLFWGNNTDSQVILDARPDNTNGAYPLFSVYGASHSSANKVNFMLLTDPDVRAVSSSTLTIGAWNHVVCQRTSGTLEIYINGTKDSTTTSTTGSTTASRFLIGANAFDSQGASVQLNRLKDGNMLSNIRFVNGTAVYSGSSITVPTSALTAITNTKFLALQSNRFVDNSTLNNIITTTSNMSISAFGPFLTDAVYDPAVNGASAYFDGSGDFLSFSHASDFAFGTGDFTIEWWSWGGTGTGNAEYIYQGTSASQQYHHLIESNGTIMRYYPTAGSNPMHDTGWGAIVQNAWTHYAVARTSGTTNLYKNGVRVLTASGSPSNSNIQSTVARIGASTDGSTTGSPWLGYITDFRIVKGTGVYTGTTYTVPTAPLTAITNTKLLLNMQDAQAIDSAAQSNLTLYGNTKISSTKSKFGDTSMYFDGTDDYATFNTITLSGDFTVEAYAYASNIDTEQCLLGQLTATRTQVFRINHIQADSILVFGSESYIFGGTNNLNSALNGINSNTWFHMAVTRQSGVCRLFVNGALKDTNNSDTNSLILNVIGNKGDGTQDWNGYADELRITNGLARYTNSFTAPTAPFADKGQ